MYIREKQLIYDHDKINVLKAGNEFYYFDLRTNRMNGENVIGTDFLRPYFHKTLVTSKIGANKISISTKR